MDKTKRTQTRFASISQKFLPENIGGEKLDDLASTCSQPSMHPALKAALVHVGVPNAAIHPTYRPTINCHMANTLH